MNNDLLTQGFTTPTSQLLARNMPQAPAPKQSFLGKVGSFGRGIVHPYSTFAAAAATVPYALLREIQNKPINDIQQQVFGTTDSGNIARQIVGDTAQVGLTALAPGLNALKPGAAVLPKIATNVELGAGMGASGGLAQNDSNFGTVAKGTAIGGATGGVFSGAGALLGRVANRVRVASHGSPALPKVATHDGVTTLPIVHGADVPAPAAPAVNPLANLSDADLAQRNYISNLQAKQGAGAQLPPPAGASPPPTVAPAAPKPADYAKTALAPNAPPDLSGGSQPTAPIAPVAAGRAGNLLQRVGSGLQKPAIGATSPASPFGATKEASIDSFLKKEGLIKAGSNSQSIYEALPAKFKEYQTQVKGLLSADKNTVDPAGLATKVEQAIGDNNHFLGSDAASDTVKQNVQTAIQKLAASKSGGILTTTDLYDLKTQIQSELTKAYDKIDKGTAPTGGEDALLAARDAINDFMPKDIKAIGQKQSMLFDAATGLNKSRLEKARLPGALTLGLPKKSSRGLSHAIQSAGTSLGVPLEAVGNAAAKVGDVVGDAAAPAARAVVNNPLVNAFATPAAVAGETNGQSAPAAPPAQDMSQAPAPNALTPGVPLQLNPQTGQLEEASQQQPDQTDQAAQAVSSLGITSQQVEAAMLQDLAENGGADLAKLNTIYTIVNNQEKAAAAAAKQPKIPQAAANATQDAQTAIQGLQDIQAAFEKTKGTGAGLISKIAGRTPVLGNNVAAVNNAIRVALPAIAKSLGYGTTAADLKALLAQLPSTSDTQKSAAVKLSAFQQKIEQTLQQNLAIQEAYQQQPADTSSPDQSLSPDLLGATI